MPTIHHPRGDIDGLYVPRKEGGRILMKVEGSYIAETLNLVCGICRK
jgi:hypothetical protein